MTRHIIVLLATLSWPLWAADDAAVLPSQGVTAAPLTDNLIAATDAIAIPRMLSYQGKLTDSLGNPVPDGNYQLTFRFYTQESGGSPFWNEEQTITVRNGLFSALLGAVNPIGSVPDAGVLYLSLQVGTGSELTPRLRIVSSAYAFLTERAANSDLLQGRDTAYFARAVHTHPYVDSAGGAQRVGGLNLSGLDSRYVNEGQTNSVTSAMIVDGTIVRADVALGFKAPYSDTADYAKVGPPSDSARVAANAHKLQGKDTLALSNKFVDEGQTNAITSAMITDGAITSADIRDTTLTTAKIKDNAITSAKIQDGTIVRADVASSFKAPYSDTADYARVAPAVDSARVAANAHKLQGKDTVALSTKFVDEGQASSVTSTMIVDGTIATADIANNAITSAKIGNGEVTMPKINQSGATLNQVIKWNGTQWAPANDSFGGPPSGPAGGDLTGTYPNPTIATGAVNSTKIQDGQVANADLAANAVTGDKIQEGTVTSADIRDTTIITAKIKDGAVTSAKITDGTIMAADLNQMGAGSGQVLKWTGSAWAPRNDSIGQGENAWVRGTPDSVLFTIRQLGIARGGSGNMLYGDYRYTHTNLGGYACTTGATGLNYYYCTVGGGSSNTASGTVATVAGGTVNTASAYSATVAGGCQNKASGEYATVGGGRYNTASGTFATVAGGWDNDVKALYGGVLSGRSNIVGDSATDSLATVAGGYYNKATAPSTFIGAGIYNEATALGATACGGYYNLAHGMYAVVAGGYSNWADTTYTTVAGGFNNEASGVTATVAGGYANTASDYSAMVGGGCQNKASGEYATVGGGYRNLADTTFATVGGGYADTVRGHCATVGGGSLNLADTTYATVAGGYSNTASGFAATVAGGWLNNSNGTYSFTTNHSSDVPSSYSNSAAFNGQTATASNQLRCGALSKASGSFTIDHPLDPYHKILNHYFIEGPEMLNIYRGSVILDASGRAEVKLPDYFSALNRNPHIQLTGVGSSDVYVAEKISGDRFVIGGKPGMEVYWQVTGERQDVSAEATRRMMPVEQEKTGELANRMLDDDFLAGCMLQLEREGKASGLDFRTAAGRARYERMKNPPKPELERER